MKKINKYTHIMHLLAPVAARDKRNQNYDSYHNMDHKGFFAINQRFWLMDYIFSLKTNAIILNLLHTE